MEADHIRVRPSHHRPSRFNMPAPRPSTFKSYMPFVGGALLALGVVAVALLPGHMEKRARSSAEAFCTGQWKQRDVREVIDAARAKGAHEEQTAPANPEVRRLRFQGLLSNFYDCVLVVRDSRVVDVRYDPTVW